MGIFIEYQMEIWEIATWGNSDSPEKVMTLKKSEVALGWGLTRQQPQEPEPLEI